jgi:hypothetical protein
VQPRTHIVLRILLDGKSVESAAGVTVSRRSISAHDLRRGEIIADGTRIDVPAHLVVIIVSSGGKSTTTLEPGASVTFVSTSSGELVSSNAGKSIFDVVPNTLDFFRVQSGEALTASVHGTMFLIDATAGSVTFTCTRGEVNITKTGYLLIGVKRLKASLIDVISAANNPQATYHPSSTWYLARFANFAQAEAFYQQQLAAAQRSGDANAVNAARMNLGNVQRLEGRYADALDSFQQSLAYYRQQGDRDREASAVNGIGDVEENQSRYADALQSFQRALALFRELGDGGGEAHALDGIGIVELDQARYADALQSHQQALALLRELGDRDGEAKALSNIGIVEKRQGWCSANWATAMVRRRPRQHRRH